MPSQTIFSTSLATYKSVVWYGQAVYRQYPKLKNHLRQHLGEDFARFFAEPHIDAHDPKGAEKAYWTSEWLSNAAAPLTSLPPAEQAAMKADLERKVQIIQRYALGLLESEKSEDNKWGQLIMKCLEIPDISHVMTEGRQLAVAAWGFTYADSSLPTQGLKSDLPPLKTPPPVIENEPFPNHSEKSLTDPDSSPDQIVESAPEPANGLESSGPPTTPEEPVEEPVAMSEKIPTAEEKSGEQKETSQITAPPPSAPPPTKQSDRRPWWRKYRWLIILLLLLLLLLLGARFCSQRQSHLPEVPGVIVPIDSTKIKPDPDSAAFIVSDRLNIALVGTNKDLRAFAAAFKKTYPQKEFQLIYYDTLTYRIQVQVPENQRDAVKAALPGQLPEFRMLIWYEGIFQRHGLPSDPGFGDIRKYWYHDRIHSAAAWNATRGDSAIVIAIIDDGFDINHPEFAGRIYKQWNVPAHSPNLSAGRQVFHGTHVAGIALAAADNNAGVAGVAPNCKLMPIQVGDQNGVMSSTAIIDAVLYAIHQGAQVINMSLGLKMPDELAALPLNNQEELVRRLFKDEEAFWIELFGIAREKNVTVVLAGGNQNMTIGLDPMQRSRSTIVVSATDPNDQRASFSNFGSLSTISAPGVQIYSCVPGNQYEFLDGTSMAAPIVAGAVALVKSVNPVMTPDQIADLLQSTGIPIAAPSGRIVGNLLQLDRALGVAQNERSEMPAVDCPDQQKRIDSLLLEIEKIRSMCPPDSMPADTMRIPPDAQDLSFAEGRWKSTTYIYNEDKERVTIYFDFQSNGSGKITLVDAGGYQCTANLDLAIKSGQFLIRQLAAANCYPPPDSYSPYDFNCRPDANGCAECTAQNRIDASNKFTFSLVKIR